jgi:outer membrane protein assembly factor BamB
MRHGDPALAPTSMTRSHGRSPRVRWWLAVLMPLHLAIGCSEQPRERVPAGEVLGREQAGYAASQGEPVSWALTTLPTSGVVVAGKAGAVCFSHTGEEMWRFEVDPGDEIVAGPAIAPDSSAFLLTRRSLVAISVGGDVLWTVPSEPADIPAVVALGDGSAVVTSGANALVSVHGGGLKWRFELPDGDTIASLPRVSSDSRIFVQGAARLYVVDLTGIPVWDQPL